MKAKITKKDGTVLELEDVTAQDLVALGLGADLGSSLTPSVAQVTSLWCAHEFPASPGYEWPPKCTKCGAPMYYSVTTGTI